MSYLGEAFYRRADSEAKIIAKKYLIQKAIIYNLRTFYGVGHAGLAQLVEHPPCKRKVESSSPSTGTM